MPRLSTILGLTLLLASAGVAGDGQTRDVDGRDLRLFTPWGSANVLLFIGSDCPVSNGFAPEIRRICDRFAAHGISCFLVYEDTGIDAPRMRAHMAEYGYVRMPAAIDADRTIARRAGASVTPQAVVIDPSGTVRYRGRINNFYAALGKPRQHVTVHDLRDALEALLAGRPIPNPETEALGCFINTWK